MYKHLYRRFIEAHPHELHFACHSHHYWPDISRDAHMQYWDDSCYYVDKKWEYFFSKKVPVAQRLIAEVLNLSQSSQIVFAPNTHEFVFRLLSSLDWTQKIRILTTDSEFYSFDRQINRLHELSQFEVVKVPVFPYDTFHDRFQREMTTGSFDLIFISHVFFNSGLVSDIESLATKKPENSVFIIDGYHSFMAVPLDLSKIEGHVFYMAGSYKYAQGGEGACFLYVPPQTRHRPFYTGWFAELSQLSAVDNQIGYPTDAMQYAGSTMDFSGLYRLTAVLELFKNEGLSVQAIHSFIQKNQNYFLNLIQQSTHPLFNSKNILMQKPDLHGHFITFKLPSVEITQEVGKKLSKLQIQTDSRGDRLRFGFGLYHDQEDIQKLWKVMESIQL